MMSPITKRSKNIRRRYLTANRPQPVAPITATSVAVAGSVATIDFDQPVILDGVPAITTSVAGATATSAALVTPMVVAVTFDAPVAAAVNITFPFEDPAIRNSSGGYVNAGAVTV